MTTSLPVAPVTPLPLELRELMLCKIQHGHESNLLVDVTSKVLDRKGVDFGVGVI